MASREKAERRGGVTKERLALRNSQRWERDAEMSFRRACCRHRWHERNAFILGGGDQNIDDAREGGTKWKTGRE